MWFTFGKTSLAIVSYVFPCSVLQPILFCPTVFVWFDIYIQLHEFNISILGSNMTLKSDIPVRPHQVGHPLFSLTTADENMRRNSNHLTSHIVMLSCWRNQRSRDTGNHTTGAISIARKPTSRSNMSLHNTVKVKWYILHMVQYCHWYTDTTAKL